MLGTFDIEATVPSDVELVVSRRWGTALRDIEPPSSTAKITIVFEEGTDVHQAAKDLYDALINLGLTA